MKAYIGTSGYSYRWNLGRSLEWYISQGFKTVEINSTFYHFPTARTVMKWTNTPDDFIFSIKVHMSISHYSKLRKLDLWEKFVRVFEPMNKKIRFWLVQMPPGYRAGDSNIQDVINFIRSAHDERLVMEFRDSSWWDRSKEIIDAGAVFCSVDAPRLPRLVINSHKITYLRMHGRDRWYAYTYTKEELDALATQLERSGSELSFVYFNNDAMFENALYLLNRFGLM